MPLVDGACALVFVCFFALVYVHVLYPFVVRIFFRPQRTQSAPLVPETTSASILIAAYNEQELIEQCLRSVIAAIPLNVRVEIHVGDDGSTDNTANIAEQIDERIVVRRFSRGGKNRTLNALIEHAQGEVVVYCDADSILDPGSLAILFQDLRDPENGASIAHSMVLDGNHKLKTLEDEVSYRTREHRLNLAESDHSSTVTSCGSLYVVRREYVRQLVNDRVADDWFPLLKVIESKKRVRMSPNAIVSSVRGTNLNAEFHRVARGTSVGIQTLLCFKHLLHPRAGSVAFFLLSHRVLRWASPLFALSIVAGVLFTYSSPEMFIPLTLGLMSIAFMVSVGYLGHLLKVHIPVAKTFLYAFVMTSAMAYGWLKVFTNQKPAQWVPDSPVSS